MGIEPTPSAWKAEVLPLNYTRQWPFPTYRSTDPELPAAAPSSPNGQPLVEGVGFEPTKA